MKGRKGERTAGWGISEAGEMQATLGVVRDAEAQSGWGIQPEASRTDFWSNLQWTVGADID